MKIDEQEFRSFIANLNIVIGETDILAMDSYQIALMKAQNQLVTYIKMLETPKKPSKWKQLTIDEKI